MKTAVGRIHGTDRLLSQVQDNLVSALNEILSFELLHGRVIQNIELQAGVPKKIEHKLGRAPNNMIVCRSYTNATIWMPQADSLFVTIQSDATAKVNLLVF